MIWLYSILRLHLLYILGESWVYICTLCIVYIDLNITVIVDVVFQLIKICFAIRMTVVNVFLFLTQSHILLTEVVMCSQG